MPTFQLGHRMALALETAGMRKQEMADYLDCSADSVSRWLHNKTRPSKQTLRLWAMRTGVDLDWLEGAERARRDSNPKPSDLGLRLLPGGLSVKPRLTSDRPLLWAVGQ